MPKLLTMKDTIDDALRSLYIGDFAGGLNSELDPQDLPLNTSPDCQNVRISKGGRVIGRDGYTVRISGLPADDSDGAFFFYDSNGTRRLAVFNDGSLYDCTTYTASLVTASVYTAGNRVAATALNNALYSSDGETINTVGADDSGVWKWDPGAGTSAILISSGSVGTIETPAAKCVTSYAGSLVLGRIKYVAGTYAKHAVMWSNVNDPTTIVGTNIFQVGQGQGGEINCVTPLGVSSVGVSPYRALFVGKSQFGVYHLRGALSVSDLSEVLISASTGVLDGATVQFIPGPDGSGFIVFLGTDYRVWYTNGVQSGEISSPIRSELAQAIADRFSMSATSKFTSVRNFASFQYVLDIGPDSSGNNIHYCYDWDLKAWTRYSGWPSGYWTEAKDSNGQSVIYCVDGSGRMLQADIGTTDGGTAIAPYWKTGYLHAEMPDVLKVWQWAYVSFGTDSGDVVVTATANHGRGASIAKTVTITASSSTDARWDVATWDSAVWAAGGAATFQHYKKRTRLPVATSGLDGSPTELLNGYDVQVKLSTSVSGAHFEILGLNLLYLPRGRKRVAV